MTTEPGQVYLVDLGMAAKTRPMLIVSRCDNDAPRALSACAPITTSTRDSEYEVSIGKPNRVVQLIAGRAVIGDVRRKYGVSSYPE